MITLGAGGNSQVMLDLLILLAAAAGVSMIVGRLKIAPIAGYLIAGAVFGPNALGVISDSASADSISQIAIVLLMFGIGLHLDKNDLRSGMLPTLGIGVVSTLLTAGLLVPVGLAFGLSGPASLAVAFALSMSSTAVVLRLLQHRRQLRQIHGQIAFGTLIAQDMIVVLVLALMPVLAGLSGIEGTDGESFSIGSMLVTALIAVGGMTLLIGFGLTLLPKLIAEAARDASAELVLVLSAAVGLGAAVLTAYLELSPELGAFVAGFLLAGTPVRFQLSGQIGPMRNLFMAVFFTAVGLTLDVGAAASLWWVLLIGLAATLVIKTLSIGGSAWLFGASPGSSLRTGLNLSQAGEFTLVVLGAAALSGVLGQDSARIEAVVIGVVFLSLLITPAVMASSGAVAGRLSGWPLMPLLTRAAFTEAEIPHNQRPLIIVAGFGPIGRAVADRLGKQNVDITVIELNRKTVERQTALGRRIIYGGVTNPEVLTSAGVERASAVVLTIPDDEIMLRACKAIRVMNSETYLAARTEYLSRAFLAREYGANHVIVEEMATAEAMATQVIASCSFEDDAPADDEDVASELIGEEPNAAKPDPEPTPEAGSR